jgi:hypothetical protein
MGMTADEFWYGDPWLFAAHREAERLGAERRDWERWQSGAYVYDALLRASAVLNPFSGKDRADDWMERPYGHEGEEEPVDAATRAINEQVDHQRFAEWILAHGPQ